MQLSKLKYFVFLVFLVPLFSQAEVLDYQTTATYKTTENYGNWLSPVFTGISGSLDQIEMSLYRSGAGGSMPSTYVFSDVMECSNAFINDCVSIADYSNTPYVFTASQFDSTNCTLIQFDLPTTTTATLVSSKYYYIEFIRNTTTELPKHCGDNSNPLSTFHSQSSATTTDTFDPYMRISTDGDLDQILPPTFESGFNATRNTRFTDLELQNVSSTTMDIYLEWFLDQTEINTAISALNPSLVRFSIAPLNESTSFYSYDIDETASGTDSDTFTSIPLSGDNTYTILAQFYNAGVPFGSAQPFSDSYVYIDFTVDGGVITSSSTPEFYDSTSFDQDNAIYRECGLTDLTGCFVNAGIYLFYPTESSLQSLTALNTTLEGKFPFSYVYDFNDNIEAMYSGTQTATATISFEFGSFGTMTLLSAELINDVPFASVIKTTLGYLLWLMLSVQLYRRTLTIFNTNPV